MAQANGFIRDPKQLMGKPVDFGGLPVDENDGVIPQFYMDARIDPLLTEGGTIPRSHPRVHELKKIAEELGIEITESPDDRTLYVVSPAGRPIHRDVECIRIIIAGDKDNIVDRPVREEDKQRFPNAYKHWKASGEGEAVFGTPIDQLPGITKAQAKDLQYFEVRTIEQFAAVSDQNLSRIGPYTSLRKRAQDWLAASKGNAPIEAERARADRLQNEVETLRKQLEEQGRAISALRKGQK